MICTTFVESDFAATKSGLTCAVEVSPKQSWEFHRDRELRPIGREPKLRVRCSCISRRNPPSLSLQAATNS